MPCESSLRTGKLGKFPFVNFNSREGFKVPQCATMKPPSGLESLMAPLGYHLVEEGLKAQQLQACSSAGRTLMQKDSDPQVESTV